MQLRSKLCLWTITLFLCGGIELTSCSDDNVASTIDPLPFPMDANKDLTVSPGDDFYQYCNGGWLSKQGPVASGAIGSIFDSDAVMAQRVEELRKEDPTVGHFFSLCNNMYNQPEASQAYIDAQKAKVKHPSSYEEAFHAIGAMVMDGVSPFSLNLRLGYSEGKMIGVIIPSSVSSTSVDSKNIDPSTLTRAGDTKSQVFRWIIEGMGVSEDVMYMDDELAATFEALKQKSLDELYTIMLKAWDDYEIYVSEESLATYNKTASSPLTHEDVLLQSRPLINYPLSYAFAKKYVPESDKQKYVERVTAIRDALQNRIMKVDWMSETTKNNALNKISQMKLYVAYPDKWYQEGLPDITECQTFVETAHILTRSQLQLKAQIIGTADAFTNSLLKALVGSDKRIYPADLTLSNAYYQPTENTIYIYPFVFLPPVAKEGISEAHAYACLSIVGHELTHGFDKQGSEYDEIGRKRNWWTVADKMAFQDKQQTLINCYNNLEYDPKELPGQYGNGERTLSEDIADLGGFLSVLDAYMVRLKQQGYTGENYKAQLRKFYESYADVWCVKYGTDRIQNFITNDVHSPARLRVNGVVMNTDLWYDLYDVTRNNKLFLQKNRRTYIW